MDNFSRKIIHVDMDCFYAAVEIRDNPSLRGKPVAVGGRPDQRSVLTTANYEARKFGVRSAMPSSQAIKICPQLVLIPPNFAKYKEVSNVVRGIFSQYTDKLEPLSLDEAYLDVTGRPECDGIATRIAKEIRLKIFEATQLTASAGIAPNKFLAKVASDWRKPNGQYTIPPDKVAEFVKLLKIEKIPGVGKVTAQKMHAMNIFTCNDLQNYSLQELQGTFGRWGVKLFDLCRGIDHREVSNDSPLQSITTETTYNKDLKTVEECVARLPELYEDFQRRFKKSGPENAVKSLVVKIKFFDFKQTTLESSEIKVPSLELFEKMVRKAYERQNQPVRLLGLGVRLKTEKSGSDKTSDKNQADQDLFPDQLSLF